MNRPEPEETIEDDALIFAVRLLCVAARRLPRGYVLSLDAASNNQSLTLISPEGEDVVMSGHRPDQSAWLAAIGDAIQHDAQDKETDA